MKKLISSPCECGYTDQEPNWRDTKCRHPKQGKYQIICDNPNNFPNDCPLQNGVIDQQSDKKVGELITNLLKSNRRNRKDCILFRVQRCIRRKSAHGGIPCVGVNCGKFKVK